MAIGFGALFSNSVLLGLPIMERAYGAESLAPTFAIISIHAPFCYLVGITAMEFARADGRGLADTVRAVASAMFRNALMIGLMLGFIVNLGGIPLPGPVRDGLDMMADAALPAALFGLGGVLTRYAIRASLAEAGMIAALSLVLHPAIALLLSAFAFGLGEGFVRSAVVTAAMAPGVNTYVFASLYARGQAQAASAILLATGLSVADGVGLAGGARRRRVRFIVMSYALRPIESGIRGWRRIPPLLTATWTVWNAYGKRMESSHTIKRPGSKVKARVRPTPCAAPRGRRARRGARRRRGRSAG